MVTFIYRPRRPGLAQLRQFFQSFMLIYCMTTWRIHTPPLSNISAVLLQTNRPHLTCHQTRGETGTDQFKTSGGNIFGGRLCVWVGEQQHRGCSSHLSSSPPLSFSTSQISDIESWYLQKFSDDPAVVRWSGGEDAEQRPLRVFGKVVWEQSP